MAHVLSLEPLTREAFAPFGDVIQTEGSHQFMINNGSTQRFHDLATVDVTEAGGRTLVNLFRAQPLSYPLPIRMLERHPLGSQAFIPLAAEDFLLVVAPAAETPDVAQIRAFVARSGQGVNYAKGVWHHPVLALKADQDFLVIDRGGQGHNCDEHYFDDTQEIHLGYP